MDLDDPDLIGFYEVVSRAHGLQGRFVLLRPERLEQADQAADDARLSMAAELASLAEHLAGKDAKGRPVFLQLLCRGGAPRFEVRMGPMGLPASTVRFPRGS